jgi:hypothetical protein
MEPRYLLDTDICICIRQKKAEEVLLSGPVTSTAGMHPEALVLVDEETSETA